MEIKNLNSQSKGQLRESNKITKTKINTLMKDPRVMAKLKDLINLCK